MKRFLAFVLGTILSISAFANYASATECNLSIEDVIEDGFYDSTSTVIQNTDTLYLTDQYATYYFDGLNQNLGYNQYGTCAHVALGMLLSYYDTFWDDDIIEEQYDVVTPVPNHLFTYDI